MIYSFFLFLALGLALFNRSARLFAVVMSVNWLANNLLAERGLFAWVAASDAAGFTALALLTLRRPTWWSFLVSELAFGAVVVHVVYWMLFGFGLYFGPQYQILLNGAFGLSALILIYGSYDVGNLLGAAWRSFTGSRDMRRRHVYSRQKTERGHSEDAQ